MIGEPNFTSDFLFQIITTSFVPYSWHPSAARLTSGVSSLEVKNSTGHLLIMTELTTPITIKIRNNHNLLNISQTHSVGARNTLFHKINVTHLGMALILKVRPEKNKTELFVALKFGKRPSANNSDINATIPNFSSCAHTPSGSYVNCSSDPYEVFVNSKVIKRTGAYFIGIQVKSKSPSRKRRCSGDMDDMETGQSPSDPQFSKGNENYTIRVMPAACLYWNTEISQWSYDGCKVSKHCYT